MLMLDDANASTSDCLSAGCNKPVKIVLVMMVIMIMVTLH